MKIPPILGVQNWGYISLPSLVDWAGRAADSLYHKLRQKDTGDAKSRTFLQRKGSPSYNLSVCFADSSPSRGASGEEEKFSAMPKPPLGRGGGSASALTERLSPAVAHGQAPLRTTSQSASQTAPLVGEPLAKPFTLRGLPKPLPLGEVALRSNDGEGKPGKKEPQAQR